MKLPCPKCGSSEVLGTFCRDCLKKMHPLVQSIRQAHLKLCVSCIRAHMHGTWREMDEEELITAALEKALGFSPRATITSVSYEPPILERKPGLQRSFDLQVIVRGKDEDVPEEYEEQYTVPIAYSVTVCENCKTAQPSYYEGTLQVRNENEQVYESIREYLKKHRRVHCTKKTSVKNGTDYYLSDNRAVGHLARQLHKEYGGILKVNAQHFSEDKQRGKILYRTSALVELPEYSKHDVILFHDTPYLVLGLSDRIKAENLETGSEENFQYERSMAQLLPTSRSQVVRIHPLEVLHPQTYQSVRPERSKYAPTDLEIDEHVRVAWHGENVFIVPPKVSEQ